MSEIGQVMRNGGFLLFVVFAWFVFTRQRDVLETAETASRILAGTLLVVLQLAYYTAVALLVFARWLRLGLPSDVFWTLLCLTAAYMLPLLVSVIAFAIYSSVLRRRWCLGRVERDHAVCATILELCERLGLRRPVDVCWTAALVPSPFVFQPLFRRATLVLPFDWLSWGAYFARDRHAEQAARRFLLLHELSHVRNADVFFMTWAGVFLWSYRLWGPIVLVTQVILLVSGPGEWLTVVVGFGTVTTAVVYPMFRLLYLSVARQRELLADARAELYIGRRQLSLVLQQSTLFAETPSLQETSTFWRVLGRFIVHTMRTLGAGWTPLAVLPAVETTSQGVIPLLSTHPSRRVRRQALRERSAIQSQVGSVSSTVAGWVGTIVGVFTNFLFVPLVRWAVVPVSGSTLQSLFIWGEMLAALYPMLALCLPLRNALTVFQPLGVQIRRLLWRFAQAGFCYLGICLMGYANMWAVFSLAGWSPEPIEAYAGQVINSVVLSPLMSVFAVGFMRSMSRIWDRENFLDLVWALVWAVVFAGVIVFPIGQIHSTGPRPLSHNMLGLMASLIAVTGGLLTIGRLITGSIEFRRRSITVYWDGRQPRVWRRDHGTAAGHLVWSALTTVALVGLVAVVPAWIGRLGFEVLYRAVPIGIESPWAWLVLFSCIAAILLVAFERSARISSRPTEGIGRRDAFLRDAQRLAETSSVLGIQLTNTAEALDGCLPAELLADRIDAPSMPWWISVVTLETLAWASYLAAWRFGSGALSWGVVEYVERCACAGGGFAFWPGGSPRLGATYHALSVLRLAAALDRLVPDPHARWVLNCGDAEGGFCSPEHRRSSLEDTLDAIQSLYLLGRLELLDGALCAKFVERRWLRSARSLQQTRRAVTCLAVLDEVTPKAVALLEGSWLPRYRSLVLSMRVDKQIEHVWSYVQIVSRLFASSTAAFDVWTGGLAVHVTEGWAAFTHSVP